MRREQGSALWEKFPELRPVPQQYSIVPLLRR